MWKATSAARLCGVDVEVRGASPKELQNWLWDFEARLLSEDERDASKDVRVGRVGFKGGRLYKMEAFLAVHPFGAVPAAFSPDSKTGIFELNSLRRAGARLGHGRFPLYGSNADDAARIDRFLEASLIFARDAQLYLLSSAASCRKCWTKFRQVPKFGTLSFVNSRVFKGLRLACALHLEGVIARSFPRVPPFWVVFSVASRAS